MRKFVIGLLKINFYFCTGILVMDAYNKVCEIHNFEKRFVEIVAEVQKDVNKQTQN